MYRRETALPAVRDQPMEDTSRVFNLLYAFGHNCIALYHTHEIHIMWGNFDFAFFFNVVILNI